MTNNYINIKVIKESNMTNNYINKSSFEKSGSTVYVVLMYYINFIYILLQREIFLDFILAVYKQSRTTDAQRGNSLHSTAEN